MTDLKNHSAIRAELNYHSAVYQELDPDEFPADDYMTVTQIDELIFCLDMPEHGATIQVYGFYTTGGTLRYALAGVRGEEFTLIYINKEV